MKKLFLLSITLLFGVSLGFAQSNTRLKSAPTKRTQNFTVSNKSGSTQKVVRGTRANDPKVAGQEIVDADGNTWKLLSPTQQGGIKSPIKGKTPVRTAPARGSRNLRR